MDAKALAKSKRAHSLQHSKKPHSAQKSKAPAGGANDAGTGNKALGKQAKEKARQSGLPSNWDRYEEEFDSGSQDPSGDTTNKASDVILPKSKGADYRYLLAEYQTQCQSDCYLDTVPSLEDILPGDFKLGLESMLSVRGKSIQSWIGDDNFVVEETAVSPEVPFLSLNLNALAEQLAKVDISERLFIEADLLPLQLTGDGSKPCSSLESDQMQTSETEATATFSEEPTLKDFSKMNKVANENIEVTSSGSIVNGHLNVNSFNQGFDLLNQTRTDRNSSQDSKHSQSRALECPTEFNMSSVSEPKKKRSTFEASTAEAELDMLLDSFSETKLLDSSGFMSATIPEKQKEAPAPLPQLARNTPSSGKSTPIAAKLDVLDDLLEETSILTDKNGSYQLTKVTAAHDEIQSSSSQPATKSKVLDDFDSWLDTI
ncbi:hypothetical protein GH714_043620 [Hevea brasiliensis]|uniref:Uncharacterized protein n=1 Tax=Hevea brasiliensis TaxID=3981 RepID=A0A6A6K509_HEVBR|nr:hypothetical protein GH714_043620 [Hevea brasiliensis]